MDLGHKDTCLLGIRRRYLHISNSERFIGNHHSGVIVVGLVTFEAKQYHLYMITIVWLTPHLSVYAPNRELRIVLLSVNKHLTINSFIVAQWHHIAYMWVNSGSGNGLWPDLSKPPPEPIRTGLELNLLRAFGYYIFNITPRVQGVKHLASILRKIYSQHCYFSTESP